MLEQEANKRAVLTTFEQPKSLPIPTQISKARHQLWASGPYLGGQQTGQVDLRDHLAAAVALPLVHVVVVFHQVPELCAALQVGGDHGCP